MFNKKGVDAIVATVLIIMITVAAVAIIWAFVLPMIKDSTVSSTQETTKLSIETSGGYTTWDDVNKIARVQVKRGNDNVNLTGLDFNFVSKGVSINKNKTNVPQPNQIKVYEFDLKGELNTRPEKVTVAPITSSGVSDVVSQSDAIQNYSGLNPLCDYSAWSVCNFSGFRNKTKLSISLLGCVGDSVVIEGCSSPPSKLIVTDATESDFNKIYTYNSVSSKWENGSYSIYKETLWYLSNGTKTYISPDNEFNVPPVRFTRMLDYPLIITVVGAGTTAANRVYQLAEVKTVNYIDSSDTIDFAWYKNYDSGNTQIYSIFAYPWDYRWWVIAGPHGSSIYTSQLMYARYNEVYKSYPDKDGWEIANSGIADAPTLEYSLEANATVSVVP